MKRRIPEAEQAHFFGDTNTLAVALWYPPYPNQTPEPSNNVHDVRIDLVTVRAADEIHVRFDFTRNGYVISRYVEIEPDCAECQACEHYACDTHHGERLREEAFVCANRDDEDKWSLAEAAKAAELEALRARVKELEASAGSRTIAEIMTDRACVEVCARECSDFLSLSPDRRAHILVEEGDRFGEPGRWRVTGHNWQSYVDKAEETKRP